MEGVRWCVPPTQTTFDRQLLSLHAFRAHTRADTGVTNFDRVSPIFARRLRIPKPPQNGKVLEVMAFSCVFLLSQNLSQVRELEADFQSDWLIVRPTAITESGKPAKFGWSKHGRIRSRV